jgi:hypothetical protein
MVGTCSHQFVWPRRGTDGRYYQVCRLCKTEFEYDWNNMQRLQSEEMAGTDATSTDTNQLNSRANAAPVRERLSPAVKAEPSREARLSFLLEREPAHRVFVQNLTDLVRSRSPRQSARPTVTTSTPATFCNNVFVDSRVPWRLFAQSLLGHMIVVAAMLIVFPRWPASTPLQRSVFHNSYISYYTPPKSFPALGSHSPRVRTQSNRQSRPEHRPTIRVSPEHAHRQGDKPGQNSALTLPPDIISSVISSKAGRLRLPAWHAPAPMMPLSATGHSRLSPAGPTWVVAPPPDLNHATFTQAHPGLLQASAVSPVPEVAGVSLRRPSATASSHAAVIAPAPAVPGSMRRVGDVDIGESAVVKPAPQLPMFEQSTVSPLARGTLGSPGSAVVAPPPSVQSSGTFSGGRASVLPSGGLLAVPPAPSVRREGDAAGSGRLNSWSTGLPVVPPAPSAEGAGAPSGIGRASWLNAGLQAVPPLPSVQGVGNASGSGRANSLTSARLGAGLQAMPPASLLQDGAQGEGQDAGNSGAGGFPTEMGKSTAGAPASSSEAEDSRDAATVEMPLRLIGPVLALPGSSYFSNYEVFIAERKLGRGRSQFVKLVYVSLPYQRRLSEYGPSYSTVYKLLVTRDHSCDESLLQMTWPETDPRPDSQHTADSPALSPKDRNGMLPCYRTTADDYRRALSRNR